jgi:hypothetical protein
VQLARTLVGGRALAAVMAYGYVVAATLQTRSYSGDNAQADKRHYTYNGKTHDLF